MDGVSVAKIAKKMELKNFIEDIDLKEKISSKTECTCPLLRSDLWYSMANRCASSWIRVISLNPSLWRSMGIS